MWLGSFLLNSVQLKQHPIIAFISVLEVPNLDGEVTAKVEGFRLIGPFDRGDEREEEP